MHIVQWCTLRFYMPILGYVKIRLNDIKPVKSLCHILWLNYTLMINDQIPMWCFHRDSHFREFLLSSEHLPGGCSVFLHLHRCDILESNSGYCGICIHFLTLQSPWSLGRRCTWNSSPAVYVPTAYRKQMWDTWCSRQAFFNAKVIRECLVSFLSWEIWTTACSHLQYFPFRVDIAFHRWVWPVISYKFTALLLSIQVCHK